MPPSQFSRLIDSMLAVWSPQGRCHRLEHDDTRYWFVYDPAGDEVARWECRRFPGCNSLIVTTVMEVREDLRGQGIGKFLRDFQHKAYKRAGFVGEINTVRKDNDAQNNIMRDMGCISMGAFPSDFGGEFRLWLTKLADGLEPVNVPVGMSTNPAFVEAARRAREELAEIRNVPGPSFMERHAPAPIIDTCGAGSGSPFFEVFCERPLGHRDEHASGSARWSGASTPTPTVQNTFDAVVPSPKKWSHRKC